MEKTYYNAQNLTPDKDCSLQLPVVITGDTAQITMILLTAREIHIEIT